MAGRAVPMVARNHILCRFEEAAEAVPEIMECYNVSGGYDFLLRIVTRSMSHFQGIMEGLLQADLGIEKFSSYVVLRVPFVKHELPLDRLFGDADPEPVGHASQQRSDG